MHRHTLRLALATLIALALVAPAAAAKNGKSGDDHGRRRAAALPTAGPTTITAKVGRGATTLVLKDTLPGSVQVRRPAKAAAGGVAFPVTYGRVTVVASGTTVSTIAAAKIGHVGGITLTKGSTSVKLRNLVIDGANLSAQVKMGKGRTHRLAIATLSQPSASTITTRAFTATGIKVTLTQGAADVLNAVLNTAFSSATVLGTVSIDTRIVGTLRR